ncbi:MAG TPA: hypothetical protein VLH85_06935 [Levilinea sp.]|nr:hypothetical protein [Levilinea sp.]
MLTTHERFTRTFAHQEPDRIPVIDDPWDATIERWQREGMPAGVSYVDYFGLDHVSRISVDNSPRYPVRVLEETAEYIIQTSAFGVTTRQWKHAASTPEFLDFTIVDPDTWRKAKQRITPCDDRIDWAALQRDYKSWRQRGDWIQALLWFGFDVTHSWTAGTERVLIALVEQPEWLMDIFGHMLEVNLALLERIWQAGYTFDSVFWYDDMGYKHNQFFSLRMYRNVLKPFHQRAIDWAHAHSAPSTGRTPTASRRTCIPAATSTPLCPSWSAWGWTRLTPSRSRRAWTRCASSATSGASWSFTAVSTPCCGTSPRRSGLRWSAWCPRSKRMAATSSRPTIRCRPA